MTDPSWNKLTELPRMIPIFEKDRHASSFGSRSFRSDSEMFDD